MPLAHTGHRSGGDGIYPHETTAGIRYRFSFRQSDGTLWTRRGFTSGGNAVEDGHVVPSIVSEALAAFDAGRGMERWEDAPSSEQNTRRRALDRLAQHLRTPARDPVRISRRKLEDTTLRLGDVVAVARNHGRIFFAVVDFHVDKGGRAAAVKLSRLSTTCRPTRR